MLDEIINYVQSLQQQVEVCCLIYASEFLKESPKACTLFCIPIKVWLLYSLVSFSLKVEIGAGLEFIIISFLIWLLGQMN